MKTMQKRYRQLEEDPRRHEKPTENKERKQNALHLFSNKTLSMYCIYLMKEWYENRKSLTQKPNIRHGYTYQVPID